MIDNLKEGRFIWTHGIRDIILPSQLEGNVREAHSRGDSEERRWTEREGWREMGGHINASSSLLSLFPLLFHLGTLFRVEFSLSC